MQTTPPEPIKRLGQRKIEMKKKPDPFLRCMPWKIMFVFSPLETVLSRLEKEGTVDEAGLQIVFREDMRGGWYDMVAALRGVIEFHEIAERLHGVPANVEAMKKFANKLEAAMPIFEQDIADVRECIRSCWKQAMTLRVSQATSIVDTVMIGAEMERLGLTDERKAA